MDASSSTALTVLRASPLNCCVVALCSGLYFWMWNTRRDTSLGAVATSYRAVVEEGQYYRVLTATVCHANALHLLFNMGTLLSLGSVEPWLGALGYLRMTLLLTAASEAAFLAIVGAALKVGPPELAARMREASAVGYSGVLFGWMTLLAVRVPTAVLALPGGFSLPFTIAPFVSLIVTQLLVPRASALGHLGGILAGYAVAWGLLDWADGYWFWSSTLLYGGGAVLLSARAQPACPWAISSWVEVSPAYTAAAAAVEGGSSGGGGSGADGSTLAASGSAARRYMAGGILHSVLSADSVAVEFPPLAAGRARDAPARRAAAGGAEAGGGGWWRQLAGERAAPGGQGRGGTPAPTPARAGALVAGERGGAASDGAGGAAAPPSPPRRRRQQPAEEAVSGEEAEEVGFIARGGARGGAAEQGGAT